MTLPSSGTLDFNSIRAEYAIGSSSNVALGSYYNGGSIVPYLENDSVPTSGQISVSNFYSGKGFNPNGLVFTTAASGGKASTNGVTESKGTWIDRTIKAPGSAVGNLIFESINDTFATPNNLSNFVYESSPSVGTRGIFNNRSFVMRTSSFSGPVGFQFNFGPGQGEAGTTTQSRSGPENGKVMRLHDASSFLSSSSSGSFGVNTYYMTIT